MKRQQGPLWGPDAPPRPTRADALGSRRRPKRERGRKLVLLGGIGGIVSGFGFVILLSDASIAAQSPSNHISLENDVYPWVLVPVVFLAIAVAGVLIWWLDRRDEQL